MVFVPAYNAQSSPLTEVSLPFCPFKGSDNIVPVHAGGVAELLESQMRYFSVLVPPFFCHLNS